MPYVIDNSSLNVLKHYYPEQFGSFWERFDGYIDRGEVISVKEVYQEFEPLFDRHEWLSKWASEHAHAFCPPNAEETRLLLEIFSEYPQLKAFVGDKNSKRARPVADPFVIAKARYLKGTVIAEEKRKPNAPKIPNVCAYFKIECVTLQGFMQKEGWTF